MIYFWGSVVCLEILRKCLWNRKLRKDASNQLVSMINNPQQRKYIVTGLENHLKRVEMES